MRYRNEEEVQGMYTEKNEVKFITLEKEIKVVGLSMVSVGLPSNFENMGKMWDYKEVFTDEVRNNIKHVDQPEMHFGISLFNGTPLIGREAKDDYFVGKGVTSYEEQAERYVCFTIPAGKYIQSTFNAKTFSDLVTDRLGAGYHNGEKFAEQNQAQLAGTFIAEVYPQDTLCIGYEHGPEWGLHDPKREANTNGYPEMYILFPVKA